MLKTYFDAVKSQIDGSKYSNRFWYSKIMDWWQ